MRTPPPARSHPQVRIRKQWTSSPHRDVWVRRRSSSGRDACDYCLCGTIASTSAAVPAVLHETPEIRRVQQGRGRRGRWLLRHRSDSRSACRTQRIGSPASTSATPATATKHVPWPILSEIPTVDDDVRPEIGESRVARLCRSPALPSCSRGYAEPGRVVGASVRFQKRPQWR